MSDVRDDVIMPALSRDLALYVQSLSVGQRDIVP